MLTIISYQQEYKCPNLYRPFFRESENKIIFHIYLYTSNPNFLNLYVLTYFHNPETKNRYKTFRVDWLLER